MSNIFVILDVLLQASIQIRFGAMGTTMSVIYGRRWNPGIPIMQDR